MRFIRPIIALAFIFVQYSLSSCSVLGLRSPFHSATIESVTQEVKVLQPVIGHYPPRFTNQLNKEVVSKKWEQAITDAESLKKDTDREAERLWLLAELYRGGHNLDRPEMGNKADYVIQRCLKVYPTYEPCHVSAVNYYLWIKPSEESLQNTETSLKFLRKQSHPALNEEVEANYIYFYLTANKKLEALKQMKKFLKAFPNSSRKDEILSVAKDVTSDYQNTKAAPKKQASSKKRAR